jgi:hypothetical protein
LKRKRKCCSEDGNVSSHAKEIMKNNWQKNWQKIDGQRQTHR